METFIDLFAGCGGFSVGLRRAGMRSLAELEIDAWAAATLRSNFKNSEVIEDDIRNITDEKILQYTGVDVIVGGPPCQGFSVAGSTQYGLFDPRNELFYWFLHWVELLLPKIAVIENVPTILTKSKEGVTVLDAVKERLEPLGYTVKAKILNSADFGTPQARRRAFIVASRRGVDFVFPRVTHSQQSDQKGLFQTVLSYVTVGEALSDLPDLRSGEGSDDLVPYETAPQNRYQEYVRAGSSGVCNHIAMKHTSRLIERFKVIKPGQSLKDVPIEYGQIAKITGEKVKKPFGYNNYRLDPSVPSMTIPASFQSLFLHPFQNRNLTAREAARIMGFPDSFVFKGKRTTMSWEKHLSQYNQIGNAVCPTVAEALGRELIRALASANPDIAAAPPSLTRPPLPLKRAEQIPVLLGTIPEELRNRLAEVGKEWLKSPNTVFQSQGFSVPVETLPAAILFARWRECPLCSPDVAPHGHHTGTICFLISKDDLHSLRENKQDHGLDYHLRASLGLNHQVGHLVGEKLGELGFASIKDIQNERTGRKVRGIEVSTKIKVDAQLQRDFYRSVKDLLTIKKSTTKAEVRGGPVCSDSF